MLTHVVLFKLRDRSPDKIKDITTALLGLKKSVPFIRGLEAGSDVVKSERSYDIALIVKLDSREDLDKYQKHPEHVIVANLIAQNRESVIAVDFEG